MAFFRNRFKLNVTISGVELTPSRDSHKVRDSP